MRLWHEELIPLLPRQQLLGQHRECCAMRELREKACNTAFCKGLSGFIAYFFITVECHFPNINFSNCTHNCTQLIN